MNKNSENAVKCVNAIQSLFPDNLFTERYKDLISYGQGQPTDNISYSVDSSVKNRICKIISHFREPICYQPDRYSDWTVYTDALECAIERLNEYLQVPAVDLKSFKMYSSLDYEILSACFTPFLFDIIELQYEELSSKEKLDFRSAINTLFQKYNIPFNLNDSGLIEQLALSEVLSPDIISLSAQIPEPELQELFNIAIEKHMQPNLQSHKDAVEKIWDVLERLKTYYTDLDKKQSVNKIIENMSCGQDDYKILFTEEFKALTSIGNSFRIRHHETDKININDIRYYDYFFNRCLSLIALALQYLN